MRVLSFFDFQVNYNALLTVSLQKGNPNQLLIYSMEVNIYIGFGTLKTKCTQYGLYGQASFKNASLGLGQGWGRSRSGRPGSGYARIEGPRLWLFGCCPYLPLWHVQHSLGVFKEPWAAPKEIPPTIFLVTHSMSWFIVLLLLLLNYKLYSSPKNWWITIQMDRSYHCFTYYIGYKLLRIITLFHVKWIHSKLLVRGIETFQPLYRHNS